MLFLLRVNIGLIGEKSEAIKVTYDLEERDRAYGVVMRIKIYWSYKACFVIPAKVKVNFDAPDRYFKRSNKAISSDQPAHSSASMLKTMRSTNWL